MTTDGEAAAVDNCAAIMAATDEAVVDESIFNVCGVVMSEVMRWWFRARVPGDHLDKRQK